MRKFVLMLIAVAGAASASDSLLFDTRIPEMPPMTSLGDWNVDHPLIPRGTKTFFTLTTAAPFTLDSRVRFWAFGVDVDSGKILYRIGLSTLDEIQSYNTELVNERIARTFDADTDPTNAFHWGDTGQLILPPPPPPDGPTGDGWLAFRIVRLANIQMHAVQAFNATAR